MADYVPVSRPTPWRWTVSGCAWALEDASGDAILYAEKGAEEIQRCWLDLIAAAPEMAALLRELEWSASDNAGDRCCPSCGAPLDIGSHINGNFQAGAGVHDQGCTLADLLARLPKEGA